MDWVPDLRQLRAFVAVTSEGELLLKRCKRVIFELEQAGRDLDSLRRWGQTRIRIDPPSPTISSSFMQKPPKPIV